MSLLPKWLKCYSRSDPETDAQLHFKLGRLNGSYTLGLVVIEIMGYGGFKINTNKFGTFIFYTQTPKHRPLYPLDCLTLAGAHIIKLADVFIRNRFINGASANNVNRQVPVIHGMKINAYRNANIMGVLVHNI